mgnify:FL=1|tara:strand:+ start:96032 stop:97816 length:1785 start_codon:yes stop_codon:yes gene_type:complete
MKLLSQIIVFFISVVSLAQGFSQEELDKLDYEELLELFNKVEFDSTKAELVARAYLERARLESDTIKMARGYDRLARIFHPEKNIAFADSVIALTENINNITYPALGYMLKAHEYSGRDLILETKNYLTAFEIAKSRENIMQQLYLADRLIIAKAIWGNKHEALELQFYRNSLVNESTYLDDIAKSTRSTAMKHIENLKLENELSSLLNFVVCYINLKKLDSAEYYNTKGLMKAERYSGYTQDKDYYSDFFQETLIEIDYYQQKYEKVIATCNMLIPKYIERSGGDDLLNLYMFKGLSFIQLKKNKEGVYNLLRADSIYANNSPDILPHQRQFFVELHDYYKNEDNSEKQIEYLNKLLSIDSVFKVYYKYFEPNLIRNIDTPRLLSQKEDLINKLKNRNKISSQLTWWFMGLLSFTIIILFYYIKKQRIYKRRFEILLKFQKKPPNEYNIGEKNKLSSSIIEEILNQLDNFEENHGYLKKDLSLRTLSKSFNTNSRYLSNVINLEKNKNFAQYINELRINHAISELMENKLLRKYTVKAIANEFGFKTSESFSKAFYKQFGIYPSYFLKNIERSEMKGKKVTLKSILKKSPSVP